MKETAAKAISNRVGGRRGCAWAATAAFATLLPIAASAQDKAAPTTASGLEEVVVTAQKRGQNLQDVPLSISALSRGELERSNITEAKDLARVDASLNISQGNGAILPFMRGVGNPSGNLIGNEASVPFYIDDVYYARLATSDLALANIERVEILKGPQGTLFGRNASGGAIQMFTRDPGSEPALDVTTGYGRFQTAVLKLYAATPVTEKLSADISVVGLHQGKGWGTNLFDGRDTYRNKYINFRSKWVAELGASTKLRVIFYYAAQTSAQGLIQGPPYRGTVRGTPGVPGVFEPYGPIQPVFPLPGFYDTNINIDNNLTHKGGGVTARFDHEFEAFDVVSISAYRKAEDHYFSEGDHTPFSWLNYTLDSDDQQISEEIQLKSKPESPISWIVGAYYLNAKQRFAPTTVRGDAIALGGLIQLDIYGAQKVNSYAGFTQATFPVVDEKTNVTLGLRYSKDVVHGEGYQDAVTVAGIFPAQTPPYDKTFNFYKLTYKVAVDHHLTDDIMGYVSASRGYKSGTFNTLPLDNDPSRPETVDSIEVGLKTQLFNNRLRLNMSAYRNDILNPQVQIVKVVAGIASVQLTNGEKAKTRGVEVSGSALITENLTLRFSGEYLDAKFIRFQNAPINTPLFTPPFGAVTVAGDASGNQMPQVPKIKFNVGASYDLKTDVGDFNIDTDVSFRGSYYWEADNVIKEKGYPLVGASITYVPTFNEKLAIRVWGQNLTGEKYYASMVTQSGNVGYMTSPGAPLTYGFEIRYSL